MTSNNENKAPEWQVLAEQYIEWDPDHRTREEMRQLLQAALASATNTDTTDAAVKTIQQRVCERVAFGTAGLRARMAAGYSCLNQLVILQTTQGLCRYLSTQQVDYREKGVVIGYDGRYHSREFAELTAAIFLHDGAKVWLFSDYTCTPMVPFAVKQYQAAAGVMITASHNPKDDNGYKLYWSNGAQIIPPHDNGVAQSILSNLQPWLNKYEFNQHHPQLHDPATEMTEKYMNMIQQYCWSREDNKQMNWRPTFTAMHGVGHRFTSEAFRAFSLPPYVQVAEQIHPDPEFPTVAFPNPEEGKGALALAIATANKHNSPLILANDPDADRLAVAEKNPQTGEWVIFNGNQIAALFADWVWKNFTKNNPQVPTNKTCMIASTVSSKFLQSMAHHEGFQFMDTLTGFKWMGNAAVDAVQKGLTFLFAYEVEIGFLVGDMSVDKDGVRTAAIFTELANQIYKQGQTLSQHLQFLYTKYGFYEMNTSYYFAFTAEPLNTVFNNLRKGGANNQYVQSCGPHRIVSIRDITYGYDSAQPDHKSLLPTMADQQMITFYFENGCVATLRNSGTEPKLKYYVEASDPVSQQAAREKVDEMTKHIINEFMQPEKTGLVAKKST